MKVTWNSEICTHSGNCVKSQPAAFAVEGGTLVIRPEKASEEAVRQVVANCPSKALMIDGA